MSSWIKCSDRMPKSGRYIVCAETDDGDYVCEMELEGKDRWMHEGEATYSHGYWINPIYWMELPAPPVEAQQ